MSGFVPMSGTRLRKSNGWSVDATLDCVTPFVAYDAMKISAGEAPTLIRIPIELDDSCIFVAELVENGGVVGLVGSIAYPTGFLQLVPGEFANGS